MVRWRQPAVWRGMLGPSRPPRQHEEGAPPRETLETPRMRAGGIRRAIPDDWQHQGAASAAATEKRTAQSISAAEHLVSRPASRKLSMTSCTSGTATDNLALPPLS